MIRLLFLLSALNALAQDSSDARSLKIPLLGYLASGTQISPIAGVPGAVTLGDPIPLPDRVKMVLPVPQQRIAIVERSGAQESGIMRLGVIDSGGVIPIENTFAHSDLIALSPSGRVAVLYSAASQQAQVVAGLPDQPHISRFIDVSPAMLPIVSIAVSDDAQTVLAGVSDGSAGALWSFAAGQDPHPIAPAGVPCSVRFFADRQDAIVADSGWKQVSSVHSDTAQVLAASGQGIAAPSDVEISADQQTIWVADSVSGLFRIDLRSGTVAGIEGAIPATKLIRLTGQSIFLLLSGDASSASVWAPDSPNQRMWRIKGN